MNVLVIAPAFRGTSPGQRFRIELWARFLEEQGFRFEFRPFEDAALHTVLYQRGQHLQKVLVMGRAFVRRFAILREARKFDVVYVYREASLIGPAIIERLLARAGVPIIYDFDDPIWMPYRSPTNGVFSRLKFVSKTAAICRLADVVLVGNRLLGTYAEQHAKRVVVIPSTIDLDLYTPKTHASTRVPVLGWTGSHSTLPFLQMIDAPLKALTGNGRSRLLIISHTDELEWPGLEAMVARKWSADREADDLAEMDIGLAPFPDAGWTPWRCHGKVLQYMAAGIPVVASPIGILPDFIEDGVNGYLAATNEEWVQKVERLLSDHELRARMGAAGRSTVERLFSAQAWAHEVGALLRSIAAA